MPWLIGIGVALAGGVAVYFWGKSSGVSSLVSKVVGGGSSGGSSGDGGGDGGDGGGSAIPSWLEWVGGGVLVITSLVTLWFVFRATVPPGRK